MEDDSKRPILSERDETPVYGSVAGETGPGPDPKAVQIQADGIFVKVYKRRWYIMIIFGLFAMTQCAVWNTFSPIAVASNHVFGWGDSDISLLTNWGPIAYVIATPAFSWVLDERGLRWACVSSAFFVALGTVLRCITSYPPTATILIHIGQFLNGLGGPLAMGGAPAISAAWFPPHERTTATAIATITNTLGLAVSFIIGPYAVPLTPGNTTTVDSKSSQFGEPQLFQPANTSTNVTEGEIQRETNALMILMYIECGWSVLVFLLFFTYFPSKPPLPPSATASIDRLPIKNGLLRLVRNRTFWLICFIYGFALGIMGVFMGVLDVNLKDHGIQPKDAGWLGFYGVIGSCLAQLVVARFADIFSKHMKRFLLALFVLGGASFLLFTLSLITVIPDTKFMLYLTYILGNIFMNATVPLFFETACEVTYPVAEGVTNLVLTLANNIAGLIFLLVQMAPIGTMWENWSLVGAIWFCVPALLLMKDTYNRLTLDETIGPESGKPETSNGDAIRSDSHS